jgi:sugar lactone lactonase YvrE
MTTSFAGGMLAFLALGLTVAAGQDAPNPYGDGQQWGNLPAGRSWGSTSAIFPHRDASGQLTGMIWVAERCAGSHCRESDLDPILLFDPDGNLIRSFGSGRFIWPHGIHVDRQANVWVADAVHSYCETGREGGKGHQVHKFSPTGELLMTLGTAGVPGESESTFSCPSDVVVSRDGSIFVGDGHNHGHGGNNRIVKFAKDGTFVAAWGAPGSGPGEFQGIHALAMDSRDRLFVGDRANQRIQILDTQGSHLETWTQFGSPSGVYIDENDRIYVADSDSGFDPDGTGQPRNPGFARGIYIGDARTGRVEAFIPDPKPDLSKVTSGAEGVAAIGNSVLGAQVGGSRGVLRYETKQQE